MAQFLDSFYATEIEGSVRYGTAQGYQDRMQAINALIGGVRLDQLNGQHLAMMKQEMSPGTARNSYTLLRRALNRAVDYGHISSNPAEREHGPSYRTKEMQVLSESELDALLDGSEGTRWCGLWLVLGRLGLRKAEALGLKWTDIDFDARRLSVTRQIQQRSGEGYFFTDLKNDESRRVIILAPYEVEALRRHLAVQLAERILPYADKGLVFCRRDGLPMSPSTPGNQLDAQTARLDLPRIRVHDLRHTAATHLIKAGVPIKVVAEQLGHRDVLTTLRTYAHVDKGMQEAAAAAREQSQNERFSKDQPHSGTESDESQEGTA